MPPAIPKISATEDIAASVTTADQNRPITSLAPIEHISLGEQDEDIAPSARRYLIITALVTILFLGFIAFISDHFSPFVYSDDAKGSVADSLISGRNFAVFDLNIDIRDIRRKQIGLMTTTPDTIILGASHWQEASANILESELIFNAHVHRDYYDDILAMVELLLVNNRLPKKLIIGIRDATFTARADRTDYLWISLLSEFRAMEQRLGLPSRPWHDDIYARPILDRISFTTIVTKVVQRFRADELPGPTEAIASETLDLLMTDGSIRWARSHLELFTPEYARSKSLEMAIRVKSRPFGIDPNAVEAVGRLLALLRERGVTVLLVHPPFNPTFYDAIVGSPFQEGLKRVEAVTRRLAEDNDAIVIGNFDPSKVGCDASMYIDAEHSGPPCLRKVLADAAAY